MTPLQIPPLESLLLLVELPLLAITLLVVVLSLRESRSRGDLLKRMTETARVVSREEYFIYVMDEIQGAEKEVWGSVTGSRPSDEESETLNRVLRGIEGASSRGVDVRYLLPKVADRLYMASRYVDRGAQVMFHPALLVNDLRYMLVDGSRVVIGLPRRSGEDEPTRKGYRIKSGAMENILRENFLRYWDSSDTSSYEEYLTQVVEESRKDNPNISDEVLAEQLGVQVGEVRRVAQD